LLCASSPINVISWTVLRTRAGIHQRIEIEI
jgi:hypothetical protein